MTGTLFNFPRQAYFGRVIPKTKFYEHGVVTKKTKECFVKQVDQIIWEYKLAPETINLPATNDVPELQVFKIVLKGDDLSLDVLRCIDYSVMFPIVFELYSSGRIRLISTYKRKSNAAKDQWVLTNYYSTDWLSEDEERLDLHYSLNIAAIYEQILKSLSPITPRQGERVQDLFERNDQIKRKAIDLDRLQNKLDSEKQFNEKVKLNALLRKVKFEIEQLTA